MATKRCPECGDTFIPTAVRCPDCGIDLVSDAVGAADGEPAEDDRVVVDVGEEPVTYTFLMADTEAVEALTRLLDESAVPYELSDDELRVPVEHELAVDGVLDLLDRQLGIDVPHGAEVEAVELFEWEDHELDLAEAELRVARIPHTWDDDGFLLVPPEAVGAAEVVLDRVEHPDALDISDDDGSTAHPELMGDLFVAADKARKEPWNVTVVSDLAKQVDRAAGSAPPFGVSPDVWRMAVEAGQTVVAAAEHDPPDEETIRDRAEQLHTLLRPLV